MGYPLNSLFSSILNYILMETWKVVNHYCAENSLPFVPSIRPMLCNAENIAPDLMIPECNASLFHDKVVCLWFPNTGIHRSLSGFGIPTTVLMLQQSRNAPSLGEFWYFHIASPEKL
jgi:hypothetical protein